MNTTRSYDDQFLINIVKILNLNNFIFNKNSMNTKIDMDYKLKQKIKSLCEKNMIDRIKYNLGHSPYHVKNESWAYEVVNKYFNLSFN